MRAWGDWRVCRAGPVPPAAHRAVQGGEVPQLGLAGSDDAAREQAQQAQAPLGLPSLKGGAHRGLPQAGLGA